MTACVSDSLIFYCVQVNGFMKGENGSCDDQTPELYVGVCYSKLC